jgi:outer membrane protein assembly factor BamB
MLTSTAVEAADDYGDVLQYEWTQPGATSSKIFASDGPAPGVPNVLWKRTFPGRPRITTAFNGLVFASQGGTTYALDAFTGDTVYTIAGGRDPIKLDDTRMLVGRNCHEIATGNQLWTGPSGFGGSYVREEKIFFSIGVGGGLVWDVSDLSQPPVLLWNNTNQFEKEQMDTYGEGLIFTKRWTTIHAINATTGEIVWETCVTGYRAYSMAYSDGRLFSGQLDAKFVCWNATTGELLWEYDAGAGWAFWAGKIAAGYGKVYSMNQDGHIYCLDAKTGKLVWRYKGIGVLYQGYAIVGGGKVYAETGDKMYHDPDTYEPGTDEYVCVDAETGELLWKLPFGVGSPGSVHAIAFGNLYLVPTLTLYDPENPTSRNYASKEIWCISSEPNDWPMWRADPSHSAEGSGPENLALRWKYQTGGAVPSSPSIADGIVYVGSHDKNIYALDADTGSKIWNFTTGYKIYSSPAVVGGKVYTGADDGNIYCLDAKTGAQLWKNTDPGDIYWMASGATATFTIRSSPTVVGGRVYVGSLDKNLYCIDADSGTTLWTFESGGFIVSSPAVVDGAVYLTRGQLYKLDANNGSVIWQKELGSSLWTSPTVADGMVFQSVDSWDHHCINATTGDIIWTYSSMHRTTIGASPLYADGLVYLTDFFSLTALDPRANTGNINRTYGNITWSTFLAREIYSSPTYAAGKVYAASEQMALYVLDAKTGEKLSFYELGSQVWSSPSLYNGRVYIGTFSWYLMCFEDADWRAQPQPSPSAFMPPQQSTQTETSGVASFITTDLAIISVVIVAIVIGSISFYTLRKQRK